jgi:hypothetical protein
MHEKCVATVSIGLSAKVILLHIWDNLIVSHLTFHAIALGCRAFLLTSLLTYGKMILLTGPSSRYGLSIW